MGRRHRRCRLPTDGSLKVGSLKSAREGRGGVTDDDLYDEISFFGANSRPSCSAATPRRARNNAIDWADIISKRGLGSNHLRAVESLWCRRCATC